eukprot:scaffold389_cov211-Alexandrium_tamarense.AAC.22
MAKKGKKAPVQTKKKVTLAKRFKCPFCANGELSLSEGAAVGLHGLIWAVTLVTFSDNCDYGVIVSIVGLLYLSRCQSVATVTGVSASSGTS